MTHVPKNIWLIKASPFHKNQILIQLVKPITGSIVNESVNYYQRYSQNRTQISTHMIRQIKANLSLNV